MYLDYDIDQRYNGYSCHTELFQRDPKRFYPVRRRGGVLLGLRREPSRLGGEKYILMFDARTREEIGIGQLMRNSNRFYTINTPKLKPAWRGRGLGKLFYTYVLDTLGYPLESDATQSPGSAWIWNQLAADPRYLVYGRLSPKGVRYPIEPTLDGQVQVEDQEYPVYRDNKLIRTQQGLRDFYVEKLNRTKTLKSRKAIQQIIADIDEEIEFQDTTISNLFCVLRKK